MERLLVEGLWKRFDAVEAVADVSFAVGEQEFFTLLGPSGCGKTTTLRCVAGLEEPSGGQIRIGGRVVSAPEARVFVPPERRSIGMVFQNYAVWPHMTVFDNVAYPLRLMKQDRATVERAVREVLALVALDGLEGRLPSQLSGGQQQRVALARAMVRRPDLLLLDEPLSNLDAKLREQMRFELKELQRRMQIPILYVTHDQAEAMGMSDRIAVMNAGRIVQVGSPQEIYTRPADRFVADFIGLMNFIRGRIVGRDGDRLVVEALGRRIAVDGPPGLAGAVTLAVRPEDLDLDPQGEIPVTVVVRSFVGNLVDYKVRVDGEVLRVQAHSAATHEEGTRTAVRIRHALLFPGEASA